MYYFILSFIGIRTSSQVQNLHRWHTPDSQLRNFQPTTRSKLFHILYTGLESVSFFWLPVPFFQISPAFILSSLKYCRQIFLKRSPIMVSHCTLGNVQTPNYCSQLVFPTSPHLFIITLLLTPHTPLKTVTNY